MVDFIEVYPDALDRRMCQWIIDVFEESGLAIPGRVGSGLNVQAKRSFDINITDRGWREVEEVLLAAAYPKLADYFWKYRFLLLGTRTPSFPDPNTGEFVAATDENFSAFAKEQYINALYGAFQSGEINLQKYLAGEGGYPRWHSEIYPTWGIDAQTLHRVLLYTFYLNDVPEAGETEFYYQERKIRPQAGSLLIAPAGFTHTHRGNTPQGGDKYIATSWFLFRPAEMQL